MERAICIDTSEGSLEDVWDLRCFFRYPRPRDAAPIEKKYWSFDEGLSGLPIFLAIWLTIPFAIWALVGGRIFLVVECFVQLAQLLESAYQLPSWSQYYPHIG